MKRLGTFILCICLAAFCMIASSCSSNNLFVLLSVRLKGNGDGTVTAVAQNEFTLGYCVLPISLKVYSSETYQTDVNSMREIESIFTEDLNLLETLDVVVSIKEDSYICAQVVYTVNDNPRYIQSDTVFYGANGLRK